MKNTQYRIRKRYEAVTYSGGIVERGYYYMPQRRYCCWFGWTLWSDMLGGRGCRSQAEAVKVINEYLEDQKVRPGDEYEYIEVP